MLGELMEWLRVNTAIELAEPNIEEYDEDVAYTESLLDAYVQGELTPIKPITDGKEDNEASEASETSGDNLTDRKPKKRNKRISPEPQL